MIALFWNCQGVGNPWIVQALHGLLQQKGPSIVFFSETKCNASVINSIKFCFSYGLHRAIWWSWIIVERQGSFKSCLILWAPY
ncbi:hypothetical protein ACFX1X_040326 [Malus domestica]